MKILTHVARLWKVVHLKTRYNLLLVFGRWFLRGSAKIDDFRQVFTPRLKIKVRYDKQYVTELICPFHRRVTSVAPKRP